MTPAARSVNLFGIYLLLLGRRAAPIRTRC